MAKTDIVSDIIRKSLSSPSPLAQQAVNRAFKRIRRREIIYRAACALVPLASAIILLILLLPNNIAPPKDDILSSPASSPSPSPEPPETETVYISKDDPYYHAFEKCARIKGETEPLMERVARLNLLYPCPVCCIFETKQPLTEAIAIGDVVIFRIEDTYLNEPDLFGIFAMPFDEEFFNQSALEEIPHHLHGKNYQEFIMNYDRNRKADIVARYPVVRDLYPYGKYPVSEGYSVPYTYDEQILLSNRYLGSSHYFLYYPDFEIADSLDVFIRVDGTEMNLSDQNGILRLFTSDSLENGGKHYNIKIRHIDPNDALYTSQIGNLTVCVYHTGSEYVLVIKEKHADPYLLENVTLRIGENEHAVNGFTDVSGDWEELKENNAFYAIVLTEYEADSIKNGAEISLVHLNFSEIAEESSYAYIPIQYGTGAYGVMDKTGEFVINPEYKDAWSWQDLSGMNAIGATGPIVLKDYADTLYLYDGETLEQIACYSLDGANSAGYAFPRSTRNSLNVVSPGIYELRRDEGAYLLNRTGEVLMSFLYDETGNNKNNLYYSATFLHETVGYPDRIVLFEQKNYTPDRMWIADLNGNRISNDFERLIPLIWTEKRAVFITVTYDREAAEKNSSLAHYEKGFPFSDYENDKTFRVGLVDQNGNELAECKYISLEVIDNRIYLTEENGGQTIISISE